MIILGKTTIDRHLKYIKICVLGEILRQAHSEHSITLHNFYLFYSSEKLQGFGNGKHVFYAI